MTVKIRNWLILAILLAYLPVLIFGRQNITVEIYNPQNYSFFPATSVLLHTSEVKPKLILFDAQFSTIDGEHVLKIIKKSGKPLKYIIVSSCGPANYFGLEPIMEAYPEAEILSSARTGEHIRLTKDAELAHWARDLKQGMPSKLYVPQMVNKTTLVIANLTIEIRHADNYASYMWMPEQKIILGGVAVYWNMHPYTADAHTTEMRDSWRGILREMLQLEPEVVIPGHFMGHRPKYGNEPVRFTLQYLEIFEQVLEENEYKNSAAVIDAMIDVYPEFDCENFLELGARTITGEEGVTVKNGSNLYRP